MAPKSKINLLPKDEFEFSTTGKFIKWAVSVGRWIVVLTEFVVICAFLSRFYFDTVLANLFDETKQRQAIVDSAADFEDNFRQIQERTKTVRVLLDEEKKPTGLFGEISKLLPLDVSLTEIGLDQNQLKIAGSALTENGLNIFLKGLLRQPQLERVSLANVSTPKDPAIGVIFEINAFIKKK